MTSQQTGRGAFSFHFEFGGGGIFLDEGGKLLRTDGDGTTEELGNIVTAEELTVILRVVLWQFKGTGEGTVAVVMSNEGTGEVTICATRREDDPTAIAGPAMSTLDIG